MNHTDELVYCSLTIKFILNINKDKHKVSTHQLNVQTFNNYSLLSPLCSLWLEELLQWHVKELLAGSWQVFSFLNLKCYV